MADQPDIQQCGSGNVYFYDGVSILDGVDQYCDRAPGEGTGVVSGMAVTADGSDMTLTVASGAVQLKSAQYSYAGGTVTAANGSPTDRRDIVVARVTAGVVSLVVIEGTPWVPDYSAVPPDTANWTRTSVGFGPWKPPVTTATDVPLVEIYVPASATVIATGTPTSGQAMLVNKSATPARNVTASTAHTPGATDSLTTGTSTTVLAANAVRLMFQVTNTSAAERVSISLGGTATDGDGIVLQPLQTTGPVTTYTGTVNATCSNLYTGTGSVAVVEV